VPEGKRLLGISVRKWSDNCRDFENVIAMACDYAAKQYGLMSVFLPMQMEKDLVISQTIAAKMKNNAVVIKDRHSVEDVMSVVSALDLCIGMRLHSLIYSAAASVPLIGLVYDPKVSSFMSYTHQNLYAGVSDLGYDNLKSLIDECMNNYDDIAADLRENYKVLSEKAEQNARLAVELYEKGSVSL